MTTQSLQYNLHFCSEHSIWCVDTIHVVLQCGPLDRVVSACPLLALPVLAECSTMYHPSFSEPCSLLRGHLTPQNQPDWEACGTLDGNARLTLVVEPRCASGTHHHYCAPTVCLQL